MKNKWLGYYALFIVAMTLLLKLVPGYNGDMPFYIACAIEKEQGTQDVMLKTKKVLEQELSAMAFISHAKRIDLAEKNILNFYRIKPVYVSTIVVLHSLGFSYVMSTLLPSLFAYCCIGFLTFYWTYKIFQPLVAFVTSVLIMLLSSAIVLARLSTPDPLSQLILLGIFYCLYFEKNRYFILALLLFSVWLRIDNLVSSLIILTAMKYWPSTKSEIRIDTKTYIAAAFAMIGIVIAVNYFTEIDFWWFKNASTQFSWQRSWQLYGRELMNYFMAFSRSFFLALIIFFVVVHYKQRFTLREKQGCLLFVLLTIQIVRMIIFPQFEERFFTAYYIAGCLIIMERINNFV